MSSKTKIVWTIKEITSVLRERQLNEFDCNIGVSGKRGDGKSTFLFKVFNSFKKNGFNQKEHQEYSQKRVTELLATQKFGFCWDDEAINSGYKRDFQGAGQKRLIKVVTNYRDNYNIYGSALPFFYSLDKDLRELIFMHVHIIERGVGVILIPLHDQIHAADPWDTKTNIKIEDKENSRIKKNPDLKFRYHRLTTFAGYIYFGPMTPKQKKKYSEIKSKKRAKNFGIEGGEEKLSFKDSIFKLMMDDKLTSDGLLQICLREGKKYSSVISELSRMLRNRGDKRTPKDFLSSTKIPLVNSKTKGAINKLVPVISS